MSAIIPKSGGGGAATHAGLPDVTTDQHHAKAHHAAHEPAGADPMAADAAAGTASLRTLGAGAAQAAAGNDARLSDARAPTAHATTHNSGGADVLAADAAAATPSLRSLGAGATQAAAGTHTAPAMTAVAAGHVPLPPNDATKYLDGTGVFSVPAAALPAGAYSQRIYSADFLLPANTSLVITEDLEIAAGVTFECAAGACLEAA